MAWVAGLGGAEVRPDEQEARVQLHEHVLGPLRVVAPAPGAEGPSEGRRNRALCTVFRVLAR